MERQGKSENRDRRGRYTRKQGLSVKIILNGQIDVNSKNRCKQQKIASDICLPYTFRVNFN